MWPSGGCQLLLGLSTEPGQEGRRCLGAPAQDGESAAGLQVQDPEHPVRAHRVFILIPTQWIIKEQQVETLRLPAAGNKPLAEAHVYVQPTRAEAK